MTPGHSDSPRGCGSGDRKTSPLSVTIGDRDYLIEIDLRDRRGPRGPIARLPGGELILAQIRTFPPGSHARDFRAREASGCMFEAARGDLAGILAMVMAASR